MSEGRRLVVMRHAKAEVVAAADHARRLARRGVREAAEAGRWARSAGVLPDHVFVSTAARTRETWTAFSEAAGLALEPEVDAGLYSSGPESALVLLRGAPGEARTVMVLGHNPTMAQLVHLLDDGGASAEAFAALSTGFPTSGLAVLQVEGDWVDLAPGSARITAFHAGRA